MTNTGGYICVRLLLDRDRLYTLVGTDTHHCPADFSAFVGSFHPSLP